VLWSATATIYDMATATFRLVVPAGTLGAWPLRCRWAILFDANGGGEAELLAEGHLHVRPMVSRSIAPLIMLTDDSLPTSDVDLPPNTYWNNGGFLCVS
jgi:hypothetical protein